MKRETKTIIYTAAITGAVALLVEHFGEKWISRFEKMFVKVGDVKTAR